MRCVWRQSTAQAYKHAPSIAAAFFFAAGEAFAAAGDALAPLEGARVGVLLDAAEGENFANGEAEDDELEDAAGRVGVSAAAEAEAEEEEGAEAEAAKEEAEGPLNIAKNPPALALGAALAALEGGAAAAALAMVGAVEGLLMSDGAGAEVRVEAATSSKNPSSSWALSAATRFSSDLAGAGFCLESDANESFAAALVGCEAKAEAEVGALDFSRFEGDG